MSSLKSLLRPTGLWVILPPSPQQTGVTDEENRTYRKELNGQTRLLLALLGVGLSMLLGIAAYLRPDQRHFGTHEQLGLPPCSFYFLFGVPCPTCGMTTSWALVMRGEVIDALRVNAGGAMLAALAILAAPWSLATAIRGRRFGWTPRGAWIPWIAGGILAVVLLQWGCRLIMHFHR